MKNIIEYLMKNKNKLGLGIFDESKLHCRIQIFFPQAVTVKTEDAQFFDVDSLIYNTEVKDIMICQEDEHEIGYCDQKAIKSIRYLDKNLKTVKIL